MNNYADLIRTVTDFPKPGIQFKDITPLLQHPQGFQAAVDDMIAKVEEIEFDTIAGD